MPKVQIVVGVVPYGPQPGGGSYNAGDCLGGRLGSIAALGSGSLGGYGTLLSGSLTDPDAQALPIDLYLYNSDTIATRRILAPVPAASTITCRSTRPPVLPWGA
jgi:hypothetical protein